MAVSWVDLMVDLMADCWAERTVEMTAGSKAGQKAKNWVAERVGLMDKMRADWMAE